MKSLALSSWTPPSVAILPEAADHKTACLAAAATIGRIDSTNAEDARQILATLTATLKTVEATRQAIKAPVLEISRQIDGTAGAYCLELAQEKDRISRALGEHDLAQRRAAEAEARRLADEARRLEQEAAELARKQALAAAPPPVTSIPVSLWDDEPPTPAAPTQAEQAIALGRQDIAQRRQELTAAKPKGSAVRENLLFEVRDLAALYAARPECVTLTPNHSVIKALLKAGVSLPGVHHWMEAATSTRTK